MPTCAAAPRHAEKEPGSRDERGALPRRKRLTTRPTDYWRRRNSARRVGPAEESLKIRRAILGLDRADTAASLNTVGEIYEAMGDHAKAVPILRQVLEINRKVLGPGHADTAISANNLACAYQGMRDYAAGPAAL